jgi:hypothetical protein
MQEEKQHTLGADLLLLLVALIWGFGFVAQRVGMEHLGPYAFNGIRFLLGGLCLVPLALRRTTVPLEWKEGRVPLVKAGLMAGGMLFVAATLQQVGIQYTTAGKAGFITGLYVVLVPMIGLAFGQRTTAGTWIGAVDRRHRPLPAQRHRGFPHRTRRPAGVDRGGLLGRTCTDTGLSLPPDRAGALGHDAVLCLRRA